MNPSPHRPYRTARGPLGRAGAGDLHFIRTTMERAASFTAVSGWGQVMVGVIGVITWTTATRSATDEPWLSAWLVAAAAAAITAVLGIRRKSLKLGMPPPSQPARRFGLSLIPPLLAGAVLTAVLYRAGLTERLPGMWLLLYGAGVMAGGTLSIKIVPVMAACFMALGMAALVAPPQWGDGFMVGGLGIAHIIFGFVIAVRHGG